MRSNLIRLAAALVLPLALIGCGGGGGSSSGGGNNGGNNGGGNNGGATTTRVVLNVDWPARSRNISALSSAQSIKVTLASANSDGTDFNWIINRDVDITAQTKRYVSPNLAKVGQWTASLKLFAQADGGGAVVGTAGAAVDLKTDGSGLDTLNVAGTIASVSVPANQNVPLGTKKDLVFQAMDAQNNIVPVSVGSATWAVVTGADKLSFVAGGATGGQAQSLAAGDATVTATVDGKTSAPSLVISGPNKATLNVTVKDPFGSLLTNSTIDLFQNGTAFDHVVSTTGTSAIQTTLSGQVDVHVTRVGFKPNQGTVTLSRVTPATLNIVLQPQGAPSASTGGSRVIVNNGASMTFEVDVAVNDGDGVAISTLAASAFSIPNAAPFTYVLNSSTYTSTPSLGPFSAFIALDASGSVLQTDPGQARIQAAKIFFQSLGGGDNAMLGYFPSVSNSPDLFPYTTIGFVSNGAPYLPLLDEIRDKGNLLGTPLYHATIQAVDIAATGPNANKAVVLFTDGESAGDTATLDQAVAEANAKGVRVYAAGLGTGTDTTILAELAQRTGGSVMFAADAGQLISFYKTLGNLLQGAGNFYRTRWTVTRSAGTFKSGDILRGNMKIDVSGTQLIAPFYVRIP